MWYLLKVKTGTEFKIHDLLTDNNIEVSRTQCGQQTDVMSASVCGGTTPDINLHDIPEDALVTAKALGFKEISALQTQNGAGYATHECPEKE